MPIADLDQCPCSGKSLARLLQPAVMAVLAREPLHGYVILQRLRDRPMFRHQGPDVTGVYRLLKEMAKRGLVKASWDLATSGPAKRRFELTASGRACLGRWIATLRHYQESVSDLLSTTAEAAARVSRPRAGPTRRGKRPGK